MRISVEPLNMPLPITPRSKRLAVKSPARRRSNPASRLGPHALPLRLFQRHFSSTASCHTLSAISGFCRVHDTMRIRRSAACVRLTASKTQFSKVQFSKTACEKSQRSKRHCRKCLSDSAGLRNPVKVFPSTVALAGKTRRCRLGRQIRQIGQRHGRAPPPSVAGARQSPRECVDRNG